MAMVRRIAVGLVGLALLGGLTVVSSKESSANSGCRLQALVEYGGLVAVPVGCEEEGPIVVRHPTELGGGPIYVTGGFIITPGASLTLLDGTALTGPIAVQDRAELILKGTGVRADGAIWVEPGGNAQINGVGPLGVTATDLINQGVTQVGGLVKLGQQGRGFTTVTDGDSRLDVSPLAVGSQLWFDRPAVPTVVARLVEGSLGPVGEGAVLCDVGSCVTQTVPSDSGELWISLAPSGGPVAPTPSASASSTPSPSESTPPSSEPTTLEELIAEASDQAVLTLPAQTAATSSVVVADAEGGAIAVTLTGGPIKRAHDGTLITVPAGSSLTLRDVTVDASWPLATKAYAPVIEVAPGGLLVLAEGARIEGNQSFGVVNFGSLNIVGPDATIANCRVDASGLAPQDGPVGGAGVWNRAGGVFWMSGGAIEGNQVVAAAGQSVFGGGVLNAGAMRLAGGSVAGNQVDGGGGGVAVVREPGSEHGGRLDVGGDYSSVAGAELPSISGNSAEFGGGVAVVDQSQWGGEGAALPEASAPDDVPSAILDRGALTANQAFGAGGAVMAYGGSAVGLDGPLTVSATNQAGTTGTDGVAVADAYLRVSGDVVTERGGGVALLKQGWPLVLTSGFTGAGQLVIEQVDGLVAGAAVPVIRLADSSAGLTPEVQAAIILAIAGVDARLESAGEGEFLVSSYPDGHTVTQSPDAVDPPVDSSPSEAPTTSAPSTQPPASEPATPGPRPTGPIPFTDPEPSNQPTSGPSQSGGRAIDRSGLGDQDTDAEETVAPPSPSTPGTPLASKSTSGSASPAVVDTGEDSESGPNLSAPEPPPGLSSKTIGFSLMAIGIFGLAGLGVYVMRRGGFFAV
ncbi:MAG: hypothetical protein LBC97_11390 [Bifidobacteriaceae bacterium]|nr:hypothetical protein [Bifidobacteriaceae bacterium]